MNFIFLQLFYSCFQLSKYHIQVYFMKYKAYYSLALCHFIDIQERLETHRILSLNTTCVSNYVSKVCATLAYCSLWSITQILIIQLHHEWNIIFRVYLLNNIVYDKYD